MKIGFNTFDIVCCVAELQNLIGMRVNNVYDIDNKTYLIKLQRFEEKSTLLLESSNRIHTTSFDWPKNMAPSGFSMKLRKHLKNKRLECLRQLGTDRIIDLQFGSGEAAYHIILELYNRGNILLTDHTSTILNVLRPHTEGDKAVRFAVREQYPIDRPRVSKEWNKDNLRTIFEASKSGDQVKKILVPHLDYGPALIEHVLLSIGFSKGVKNCKEFKFDEDCDKLLKGIELAEEILQNSKTQPIQGYIIQKRLETAQIPVSSVRQPTTNQPADDSSSSFLVNEEFHPYLFLQHADRPHRVLSSFNQAADEFYSALEGDKIAIKTVQREKDALKKLANVREDHNRRLEELNKTQMFDKRKAELIARNEEMVERAILAVQTILATQISWEEIETVVKEAAEKGDPVAKMIKQLKLQSNHISLLLSDPYEEDEPTQPMVIDVDLALTAYANATRYYDQKRNAAKKQQKTIESQSKAFKSAEKKTKQMLKEVQTVSNINRARKVFWFEKFFWFISSENYLVIAGRDQQQNEFIVKRYMSSKDIYVHADIHGASSVIIKNPTGAEVPPKTLNEAGTMAICYSVAWDAKVVTNAYWVRGDQVSKTAPTGEYLSTGSFMVRGKKNFLPPGAHLVLGLAMLFRLEDGSVERHSGERKTLQDVAIDIADIKLEDEQEINCDDASDVDSDNEATKVDEEEELIQKMDEETETKIQHESNDTTLQDNKLENIPENEEDRDVDSDEDDENVPSEKDQENYDSEEESKFPDTHIKIQHFQGTEVNIVAENMQKNNSSNAANEDIIYLGDDKPVFVSNSQRSRTTSHSSNKSQMSVKSKPEKNDNLEKETQQQTQSKRGQKSKLKKIKEKYRDQDEEERQLRMTILQSSGTGKDSKKNRKNDTKSSSNNQKQQQGKGKKNPNQQLRQPQQQQQSNYQSTTNENGPDDEEETLPLAQANVDMLDTLTGLPVGEDELLFAVPVVAPYNTLSNYKYKVKLTPGTNRRGKAAKTAVAMFLHDRLATPREKDLLKAIKDDSLARNIPGKVKLSGPRINLGKK